MASPHSFIRRVVEMAFRQVSWLDPIGSDVAFSRISAQWLSKHRLWDLTVAVTARDLRPLPYSLSASVWSSAF